MSTLRDRIAGLAGAPGEKRSVNGSSDLTVVGLNWAATDIPLQRIAVNGTTITYQDLQPLIAADGAPIAATMPGSWGQLYAAGRA